MPTSFILRPWKLSDLDSLLRHANNWNIAKYMTDQFPFPYTEEAGRGFIAFATKDDPVHIFAIEVEGQAVGGIGIHPQSDIQRRNAELGYWLGEEFRGRGMISSAIHQAVQFAFDTYDIDRVFARPFGSNIASQRVLEKNGFSLEARLKQTLIKNGVLEDELIYAMRRDEWAIIQAKKHQV